MTTNDIVDINYIRNNKINLVTWKKVPEVR